MASGLIQVLDMVNRSLSLSEINCEMVGSHFEFSNFSQKKQNTKMLISEIFDPQGISIPIFKKKCASPKMAAILNFRIFRKNCKTQKCLYLENHARWSDFDTICKTQGISAELISQ